MSPQFDFPETQVHEIWRCQALPLQLLQTEDGQRIEVVNPGRYNSASGPDFRRALLRLGDKLIEGDVECHLHAADWEVHGHHRDPAYNEVVLHIAVRSRALAAHTNTIMLENGLLVPQLLLPEKFVRAFVVKETSLLACPLHQTSAEKIFATVHHAGGLRLAAKAQALAEQVSQSSWDQAVYRGIAEALGYDKNQEPFRILAELLPIELLFAELRATREHAPEVLLEALLFGAAGFLTESGASNETAVATFLTPRKFLWEELRHTLQIRPLRPEAWHFFRLRPPNFPTRRLAAFSQLILKFYRQGILEHLAATVQALGGDSKKLMSELLQYFICPAEGFWQSHYDLRGRPLASRAHTGDLIGRERALDILVNIILPGLWCYFREADNAILQNQVQEAYGLLPKLQENQITRTMRAQLSRKFAVSGKIAKFARDQQGLIYLQKLYCRPLRCEECLRLG